MVRVKYGVIMKKIGILCLSLWHFFYLSASEAGARSIEGYVIEPVAKIDPSNGFIYLENLAPEERDEYKNEKRALNYKLRDYFFCLRCYKKDSGETVGLIFYDFNCEKKESYLAWVFVLPSCRGKGIGSLLMYYMENNVRGSLLTLNAVPERISFYQEKHGYKAFKRDIELTGEQYRRISTSPFYLKMQKDLS